MFVATDLHGHTHYSDGRTTPAEYVEFRRALGMKAIAISDHDLMAGVREGAEAAASAGMLFLPATEITAHLHYGTDREEQFHILAYYPNDVLENFQLETKRFYQRGLLVQTRWKELVLEWLSKLTPEDRDVLGSSELEALPPHQFPALQSTILRITARKRDLFESFRDYHQLFWNSKGPNKDLFGWTPEEAIEAIRDDGATEVIAHAARYRDKERTLSVIDYAKGLEVYTSRHKAEVASYYRELADQKKKLWTASSDDHQNAAYAKPPTGTPLTTIERICRRPMRLGLVIDT